MKYRELAGIVAIVSVLAILPGCGGGSSSVSSPGPFNYPQTVSDARAMMQAALKSSGAPSATIGLFAGNRVVWTEAFGMIDKANNVPATQTTMFAIGSTSKLIAGMAVMKLVDQGKLNLDTPLVNYLPNFKMASPEYTQVTVRMLVSHTAGFPGGDYRNDVTYGAPELDYDAQAQQTLATERFKYRPGKMPIYCNQCFGMIDPLVAAVSDEHSYTKFVEDEIFTPLGMTHSQFADAPFQAGSFAPSYLLDPNAPDPQLYTNNYPAGAVYSTPDDMGHVAIMLMNGGQYGGSQILSAAAVAEMGRDQTADLPFNPVPAETFGLGWDDVSYAGLAAVGVRGWDKPGGTVGYVTQFIVAPDAQLAVIVTGVSFSLSSPFGASYTVAEHTMLEALAESGRIPAIPKPLPNTPLPEQTPTDAQLAQIVGNYADFKGLFQVAAGSDRTLTISQYSGGAWLPKPMATGLKFRIDGTFSADTAPNISYRALNAGGTGLPGAEEPTAHGQLPRAIDYRRAGPAGSANLAGVAKPGRQVLAHRQRGRAVRPSRRRLRALHAVCRRQPAGLRFRRIYGHPLKHRRSVSQRHGGADVLADSFHQWPRPERCAHRVPRR